MSVENSDFIVATAHPYWGGITDPQEAVNWTLERYQDLVGVASEPSSGKTLEVILKEVGLPSDGDPNVSEEGQALYYDLLQDTEVVFFYFEGFDQYWKDYQPVEPYRGLFDMYRNPKQVVEVICEN